MAYRRYGKRRRAAYANAAPVAKPALPEIINDGMQPLYDGRYDSVEGFLESLRELRNESNRDSRDRFLTFNHGSWYGAGCATGQDVMRLLSNGWQEGRDKVNAMLAQIGESDLTPRDMRRRLTRGDMGDSVDMGAVYAGRFQTAWTRAARISAVAPQRVEILANMLCRSGESPDVLLWRGVAAIALADKLESAGYTVRIVVGFGGISSETGEKISCRITVKDHDKPLDITTASAVLLPGFFRALGHCWQAAHHAKVGGASMSVERGQIDDGEIFLSHDVKDRFTALEFVRAQIARLDSADNEQAVA